MGDEADQWNAARWCGTAADLSQRDTDDPKVVEDETEIALRNW